MRDALAHPVYRRLLAAQVLSVFGSGLTTVALGLLAFELAGADAGAVLGIALMLKMVAYVGLAPIVTALAAHLPRRPFLISLDLCRAALVLVLPFVTEVWQIYALVFAFQAFSAAFSPTFQATIPDILTDERHYTQALSLSRLSYDLESLLSPLLAGLLLSVLSFHWLFAGTALGFLASAALVRSVVLPQPRGGAVAAPFVKRVTRGGWIYLSTPRLRGMLALYLAVAAASAMVIVNTVVRVKSTLALGDAAVALHFAAYGLGSMVVALTLPRLLDRVAARPVMLAGGVALVPLLALAALGPALAAGLLLWAALGAAAALVQTPSGLILRRSCAEADRPAVFAAQFALTHACWLLAYPAAGLLGAALGLNMTFALMAVAAAAATLAAWRLWPAHDPEEIVHDHGALTHAHAYGDADHHLPGVATHHHHPALRHAHRYVIDDHHPRWPVRVGGGAEL
ncbi:MAG: MFS transporter [Alphaproteobacteria bacterium HGW-Alphaproteobacteria-4]|nr:MAG: MFS transporter [Alphaproteobacteria bacterium HGW-Alphaproteobacteria-4]